MKPRLLAFLIFSVSIGLLFGADSQPTDYELKGGSPEMTTVRVRYFVNDLDSSISFYTKLLGFHVNSHPSPNFAILSLGDFQLLLNTPTGPAGAAQAMPDGRKPQPGGWNRIDLVVSDLTGEVARLRGAGAHFRNDVVKGIGGSQILLEDPSGNPIELFQPSSS